MSTKPKRPFGERYFHKFGKTLDEEISVQQQKIEEMLANSDKDFLRKKFLLSRKIFIGDMAFVTFAHILAQFVHVTAFAEQLAKYDQGKLLSIVAPILMNIMYTFSTTMYVHGRFKKYKEQKELLN